MPSLRWRSRGRNSRRGRRSPRPRRARSLPRPRPAGAPSPHQWHHNYASKHQREGVWRGVASQGTASWLSHVYSDLRAAAGGDKPKKTKRASSH